MITAIVRYKLPATIGKVECREHFLKIAKGHGEAKGLVRKTVYLERERNGWRHLSVGNHR